MKEPKKPKPEPKPGKPATAKELSDEDLRKIVGGALAAKKALS